MALRDGLDFFLKMEEAAGLTRQDATGNGQAFADVNDVAQIAGQFGNAALFDAVSSQYLYRGDGAKTNLGGAAGFTVRCIVRPTTTGTSRGIWAKGIVIDGVTNTLEAQLIQVTDNRFLFYIGDGFQTYSVATLAGEFVLDDWNDLVCRYDPVGQTLSIRNNCGTWHYSAFTGTAYQGPGDFEIGRFYNNTPVCFTGAIDSFAKWSRAITDAEADLLCLNMDYPWQPAFPCSGYLLKFGDYEFENMFHPAEDPRSWVVPTTKLPRAHGSRQLTGYRDAKRLVVRGGQFDDADNLLSTGVIGLRTKRDALLGALAAGPANLYFDDDRYWREVQCTDVSFPYGPNGWCRFTDGMEIVFVAGDPFQYEVLTTVDTWASPVNAGTRVIIVGGNAPAAPVYRFTVGGSGPETIDWTLKNSTTGASFSLTGDVLSGDVIVVDTLLYTVKIGTDNEIALFDGQFVQMEPGANTLQITIAASAISQISIEWANRWH